MRLCEAAQERYQCGRHRNVDGEVTIEATLDHLRIIVPPMADNVGYRRTGYAAEQQRCQYVHLPESAHANDNERGSECDEALEIPPRIINSPRR